MHKRISVEQLRLGMYIHELGCSWMDHPFWRKTFLLDDPNDLKTILATKIKLVWIDTSKGADVDEETITECETEEEVNDTIESTLALADSQLKSTQRISLAQEAALAVQICAKSRDAVASMFQETRMGSALNSEEALPIVEEISNSVIRNPGALISLARLKDKDDYTYPEYCINRANINVSI